MRCCVRLFIDKGSNIYGYKIKFINEFYNYIFVIFVKIFSNKSSLYNNK